MGVHRGRFIPPPPGAGTAASAFLGRGGPDEA